MTDAMLAAMRALDMESEAHMQAHRRLSPPAGCIAVGGAHFDEFLIAQSLQEFLRGLRRDLSPWDAAQCAKDYARLCVGKWNRQRGRDYQTHRWEGAMDTKLEDIARRFMRIP